MTRNSAHPRGILLDIDGVLIFQGKEIPGARDCLAALDQLGIPYLLATNTTRKSCKKVAKSLLSAGIALPEEKIFTPLVAATRLLAERGWSAHYLISESGLTDLPPASDTPDAVLVGDLGDQFSAPVLNRAFRHLKAGAKLLAAHKNRWWVDHDQPVLDAGPFVAALEFAAETEAELIGKPSRAFFEAAVHRLLHDPAAATGAQHSSPSPVVMVGDRWDSDIAGAQDAGLAGILVETGLYEKGDDSRGMPSAVLDSIADLPAWLAS